MAAVVREVTCLVNSDNERNRIAPLCDARPACAANWGRLVGRGFQALAEGSHGDGRSVMPLDALDRTRNTMPAQARTFAREGLQTARKAGSVGIEDCKFLVNAEHLVVARH